MSKDHVPAVKPLERSMCEETADSVLEELESGEARIERYLSPIFAQELIEHMHRAKKAALLEHRFADN